MESAAAGPSVGSAPPARVELSTSVAQCDVREVYRQVLDRVGRAALCYDPRWLPAVCRGLRHRPYLLVAKRDGRPVGVLPLALVKSWLFGRFLVSLP
jgi:hypothetical protein